MENIIPVLIVGGLAWWLWRRNKRSVRQQERQAAVCVDDKHHVYTPPNTPDETRIAELHKEAAKFKVAKDWDNALACLREAERLKSHVSTVYPVAHSLRLPLFLQQAGQFDAAMQEFQALIDDTEARILRGLPKRNVSSKNMLVHAEYAKIYAAMGTACTREKQHEQAAEYTRLAEGHGAKHAKMLKADMAREAKKRKAKTPAPNR